VTGLTSSWWDELVGLFIPSRIDVDDLCALNLDDPAFPSLADVALALARDPSSILTIRNWWRDKLRYTAFAANCVCNSPPAFTCTTHLSHPYNPSIASGGVQDYGFAIDFTPSADVWCYGGYLQVGTVGTGVVQHGINEAGGFALNYLETVVPTTTDTAYFFTTPQRLYAGHTYKYLYQFVGPGWVIKYNNTNSTPSTNAYATFNAHAYKSPIASAWLPHSPVTTSPDPIFCPPAGTPPLPVIDPQPPEIISRTPWTCTTIGDLCTRLYQLSLRVDWLRTQVAYDSSRLDPYSYVASTVHSSLTGDGLLTVSDILGVLVELTTVPSSWGSTSDTPPRYIPSPGVIQFGTTDGLGEAVWVHYADQFIVPAPGLTTRVSYNFKAGVTGRITELLRSD